MTKSEFCKILCVVNISNPFEENVYKWMIDQDYKSSWYIDHFLAGLNKTYLGEKTTEVAYETGIPIGEKLRNEDYKVYNHLTFNIFYSKGKHDKPYTIVDFSITPFSIMHKTNNDTKEPLCSNTLEGQIGNYKVDQYQRPNRNETILYTYDVVFYESKEKYTSRWDFYLKSSKVDKIHWYSFSNSTLIILIFTALLAHILVRALKKDIDYINSVKFIFIINRELFQMILLMIVDGNK
jgi:transmembrane 9 superfamily protein 2/4